MVRASLRRMTVSFSTTPQLGVRLAGTVESSAEGAFDVLLDYAADVPEEAVVR